MQGARASGGHGTGTKEDARHGDFAWASCSPGLALDLRLAWLSLACGTPGLENSLAYSGVDQNLQRDATQGSFFQEHTWVLLLAED